MPTIQDTYLGPQMNFIERLSNFIMCIWARFTVEIQFYKQNVVFKKHVSPNFPPLEELFSKAALIFTAGDEFINPSTPTLNKVILIF